MAEDQKTIAGLSRLSDKIQTMEQAAAPQGRGNAEKKPKNAAFRILFGLLNAASLLLQILFTAEPAHLFAAMLRRRAAPPSWAKMVSESI